MHAFMVRPRDDKSKPLFQFREGEGSLVFWPVFTALKDIGEGGSRQFMDPLHERSDHSLHDAAIMRRAYRAMDNPNAMGFASSTQSFAMEVRTVIDMDHFRLAGHRPFGLNSDPL
jgi:hypothetical protein